MKKARYRVHNWPAYNQALVNRGSISLWFHQDVMDAWSDPQPTGKPGRPYAYSHVAMTTLMLIKCVLRLAFRQIEGFARSLVQLLNLDIKIPSYTQMCRRQSSLKSGMK